MRRQLPVLAMYLIIALLVSGASAAVYSTNNAVVVSLKYNNGDPAPAESFMRLITGKTLAGVMEFQAAPPDPERELINVITISTVTDTYSKNLQTAPASNIYVTATTREDTNVMQTTTEPGYPILEIYWGYDKSPMEPWRYYMRVNDLNDGYAVLGDFRTKVVWQKPVTAAQIQGIIGSGTIPAWESVR